MMFPHEIRKRIVTQMCYTQNHAYGLMPEEQQKTLYRQMDQLFFHMMQSANCKELKYYCKEFKKERKRQ